MDNTLIKFDNLARVMADYAHDLEYYYKENIDKSDKVASGNLLSSVSTYIQMGDNDFTVVLNVANYWKYVENGRRPGKQPPVDKIREWLEVKSTLPVPKGLEYYIAKKIGERGIPATPILEPTLEDINREYEERISEAITYDLDALGDSILFTLRQ